MSAIATELADLLINCVHIGPVGIIGLGIAEKLFPFVPSYVAFVVIGIVVAAKQSDLTSAILALAIGSTAGSLCWYGIGLILGERRSATFVRRFGPYIGLTPARYQRAANAFQRNLVLILAVGQTLPVIRVYIAIPAGVLGVPLARFLLGTFIGSLVWGTPLLALGFWIGDTNSDPAFAALIAVATLIGLEALIVWGCRRFNRRTSRRHPAPS
ncbi:DedA family protein [Tardiphaga sp. P9-11]|jgi:alkaline phosphatase|uniref:DedA family protein n=1 Tax=Tardiphaga sp. P9-11 TaxID=2024614 RepID=UPI0011F225E6|nr:DedA family protein [Tardiphaga sp. P9-11]KAA0071352.1 DedA family protein [Tardiphaga sp. P9-11]